MGTDNFYDRFIHNFAQIAIPITHLLKELIHFE